MVPNLRLDAAAMAGPPPGKRFVEFLLLIYYICLSDHAPSARLYWAAVDYWWTRCCLLSVHTPQQQSLHPCGTLRPTNRWLLTSAIQYYLHVD